MIAHRSRAAVEQVFAPKIRGTQVLLQGLADVPLDFVLLCSSLSALTGDFGQVDYCAANCVLDAMAVQAGQSGTCPVVSINWDAWREVGMAAAQQGTANLGMTPQQGASALEKALAGRALPQVIISTGDCLQASTREPAHLAARLLPTPAAKRQLHARPALQTAYVEPLEGLEQAIAQLWTEFLGITPIGAHDNLFELGGDSLLALQLLAKVRSAYQVEVGPAELFDSPTVAALADLIELRLIDEIERGAASGAVQEQRLPAAS
jgi:phthiocerol/phenolphthiocerol synthesis type-I polyketide synthase E